MRPALRRLTQRVVGCSGSRSHGCLVTCRPVRSGLRSHTVSQHPFSSPKESILRRIVRRASLREEGAERLSGCSLKTLDRFLTG